MADQKKDVVYYQLVTNADKWTKFKSCLRKVYWKETLTINEGINKIIDEFIKKNE